MKIAVLGLDGLSYDYLNKLVERTDIHYIKDILLKGTHSELHAFPPMTPPSWTSIMSGVDPSSHGIYDFTYVVNTENEFKMLISADHLEHPRIHEMMGFMGRKSIMINPVPSFPLFPIKDSIQISNSFFTPKKLVYPNRAMKYAKELSLHEKSDSFEESLNKAVKYVNEYIYIVEELIDKEDYEFFWLTLPYPDHYLHKAGNEEFLRSKILPDEARLFRSIDKLTRIFYENNDIVIIVSDHGFSDYKRYLFVNTYLYMKGYVKPKTREEDSTKGAERSVGLIEKIRIKMSKHENIRRLLRPLYRRLLGGNRVVKPKYVDQRASLAYLTSHTSFGINVNAKSIIPRLIEDLQKLDGIKNVYRREELFRGPFIERLPDIYIEPDFDNKYFIGDEKIWIAYINKPRDESRLNHYPIGVFIISKNDYISNLPKKVQNYEAGNIILSFLNLPLSIYARNINLIKSLFGENIKTTDIYVKRWRLIKKIRSKTLR